MPPESTPAKDHAAISDISEIEERSFSQRVLTSQSFWVTIALLILAISIGLYQPTFFSANNLSNITRNFSPFGIMALGMTCVIITGGIDLSVGSIMGLVAIVAGLFLTWEYPWWIAFSMGMFAGLGCGLVNGFFIAYMGMSPFVVTLGMMSIARSLAVVTSGNQMLYKFGPDAPIVKAIGQAKFPRNVEGDMWADWIPSFSSHFWTMVILALIVGFVFSSRAWGRHLFAIGGNEHAARLAGVNVNLVKCQVYIFSAFTASISSLLILGYSGSAINALGQSYELRVIAATVIGGANLMGGSGTAYGAIVGAALLEVIRNALLMAGIDSNWQGAFVGAFIIIAVMIGLETNGKSFIGTIKDHVFGRRNQ